MVSVASEYPICQICGLEEVGVFFTKSKVNPEKYCSCEYGKCPFCKKKVIPLYPIGRNDKTGEYFHSFCLTKKIIRTCGKYPGVRKNPKDSKRGTCLICMKEVEKGQPRVKDSMGRYWHMECL